MCNIKWQNTKASFIEISCWFFFNFFFILKVSKYRWRTGGTGQCLRALPVLPDPSSDCITHAGQLTTAYNSSTREPMPLASWALAHTQIKTIKSHTTWSRHIREPLSRRQKAVFHANLEENSLNHPLLHIHSACTDFPVEERTKSKPRLTSRRGVGKWFPEGTNEVASFPPDGARGKGFWLPLRSPVWEND